MKGAVARNSKIKILIILGRLAKDIFNKLFISRKEHEKIKGKLVNIIIAMSAVSISFVGVVIFLFIFR